jgi:hypothetical protein
MKKLFALLAIAVCLTPAILPAATSAKLNGWISDSMCGAKHQGDNPACVKKCITEMGAKPVFVDEEKKAVWVIDNPEAIKDFYGEHVSVTATADAEKMSVHIDAVEKAN